MSSNLQSSNLQSNYEGVWGSRIGFGKKPALISIDFMKGYTDTSSPLYAEGVVTAVNHAPALLAVARQKGVPVIHTNILYHPSFIDGGVWLKKAPVMKAMVAGNVFAEFCPQVMPHDSELVLTKQYASAFFGTSLAATLTAEGIDTVILIGCSTSGCIRASAVDAMQYGFRAIVVRDCVGDRHPDPHEANLFDIDSKYGDVVMRDEVINYFEALT
ncbi:N-carbamoylsarcosine amidohydrolase [Marinomonas sp.]|nr:N-carbamoylsarcosine amidohydrolase [Marinomonas sp.]MDB4836989.1 N-carbamoylsarcosine amidohydrolase [Marinomonas sp.]